MFSLPKIKIPSAQYKKICKHLELRYEKEQDPWGMDIDVVKKSLKSLYPIYKNYFKVRTFGKENVGNTNYIFVSNHTGQIAIDGMLITMANMLEFDQPRIVRGMIERWMATLPFIASFTAGAGTILGDRDNCLYLLKKKESILVFPEGVRGISKSTPDYYKLQSFTEGFYRMAAQTKTAIIPVAVVGAEEFFPFVYQAKFLHKLLGLPSMPLTPNLIPLPSPVDIHFGKPIEIPNNILEKSNDEEIAKEIKKIKSSIKKMLREGLKNRRPFLEKFGLKDKRSL